MGPHDILIRMRDHSKQWAEHDVDLTEVLMVLVVDNEVGHGLPIWSPVRLCDWASLVRPRPLIAKREDVHPTYVALKELYRHAYEGSCELFVCLSQPQC